MAGMLSNNNPMGLIAQGGNAPAGLLTKAQTLEANNVMSAPSGYRPDVKYDIPAPMAGDGEGYVKGVQAAIEMKNSQAALTNQNRTVDMGQERLSYDRTDREKKRAIDDGMMQAAQIGGFSGVVDYLKTVDPDRALVFNTAKQEMDQKMIQTDLMRALAPVEQAKAMAEGYGVLGKMGKALLDAPPADRQNMYQHMQPIMRAVLGNNIPASVEQAAPLFMLGAAQATPADALFKSKQTSLEMKSKVGELMGDVQKAASLYGTDSEQYKLLRQHLGDTIYATNTISTERTEKLLLQSDNQKLDNEAVMRKEWQAYNKDYKQAADSWNKVDKIAQVYQNAPPNANLGATDMALVFTWMKTLDPTSVVREGEYANAQNSAGVPEYARALYNKTIGEGQLSPVSRNEIIKSAKQMYDAQKQSYDQSTEQYRALAKRKGLDPDAVTLDLNSTLNAAQKDINGKADALITKYANNPAAITKIEAVRKQELSAMHEQASEQDRKAEELVNKYK